MKFENFIEEDSDIFVSKTFRFPKDKNLGDYSDIIIFVEKGPRGEGAREQYRVSWGSGNYDVDWIETSLLRKAVEVKLSNKELAKLKYIK